MRSFNLPSVYASTSRVQLAKEAPDPTQTKYMMYWDGVQQQYLNTQIKVFASQTLGLEVIRSHPDIAKELEVEFGTDDPDRLAMAFSSGVRVKSVTDTYLVDVGYESQHADRCARYANALAQAYIGQLAALWGRKTQVATEKIGEQAQVLYQKLGQSEAALRTFLKQNESPLFESQRQLFESRTSRLDSDVANVQRQKNRLAADLEAIKLVLHHGRNLITAAPIAASAVVQGLSGKLADAELELTTLRARYGESWHQVKAAKARRDQLKLLLRREMETIQGRLESELNARVAEEKGLLTRRRQLKVESSQLDRRMRLYDSLKSEVEANRSFYEEFAKRLKDVKHYGELNVTNVRIIDRAAGSWRVRPSHSRNVMLGFLAGLALGIGLALLLERLSDRIRSLQEAIASLRIPALGVVPEVADVAAKDLDLHALASSRSVFAESFRRARVQLNAIGALPPQGCGVLLCSSGVPREGKTLCVINLAIACAQAGRRTLLIDGDMRNPRAHRVFQHPLSPGLGECLEGPGLQDDMLLPTQVENLFVLPAGSIQNNPAEALARSDGFPNLIAQLRGQFDRILIDTPPVAAVSDGTQMAPAADAVLLIVSARQSSRAASTQALTELARVGKEPCGLLFNQQGHGDVGYYYYSKYYGRYTDPGQVPPS